MHEKKVDNDEKGIRTHWLSVDYLLTEHDVMRVLPLAVFSAAGLDEDSSRGDEEQYQHHYRWYVIRIRILNDWVWMNITDAFIKKMRIVHNWQYMRVCMYYCKSLYHLPLIACFCSSFLHKCERFYHSLTNRILRRVSHRHTRHHRIRITTASN